MVEVKGGRGGRGGGVVVHETARITPQAPQATRAKAIEKKPAKHGETVGSTGAGTLMVAGTVTEGQDSNRGRDNTGAGTVTEGQDSNRDRYNTWAGTVKGGQEE